MAGGGGIENTTTFKLQQGKYPVVRRCLNCGAQQTTWHQKKTEAPLRVECSACELEYSKVAVR